MFNPVVVSVVVMIVLCLANLNVLMSLMLASLTGGLLSGMGLEEIMNVFINGMGDNAETALSYILLGAFAAAIQKTGLAGMLARRIASWIKGKGKVLVGVIAFVAIFSQNLVPVHIAFIPILIPPLIGVMNKLEIDRRAVACALTFGLKAPYVVIPAGFGWIFHNIISDAMADNNMAVATGEVWRALWPLGLAMLLGLVVATFYTYSKPRQYQSLAEADLDIAEVEKKLEIKDSLGIAHYATLLASVVALGVQVFTDSLPLGALLGLGIMVTAGAIKWEELQETLEEGIGMMGYIAFVMLTATGYANVVRETGAVDALVDSATGLIGSSQFLAAVIMIVVGLVITMGIGTSFGTVPIIAAIYVPLALEMGFSPLATVALIGTAGALGDAGSPASDSTLGPTAGLNVDSQHDHIWDTCVPTFVHFNIPLMIFGILAAMVL